MSSLAGVVLVALILVPWPAVDALDIASRSVKARPSEEYSPHTAWELGAYGCGVTIGVMDGGVDSEHPWLVEKEVGGKDFGDAGLVAQTSGPTSYAAIGNHGTPVGGMTGSHAGHPFSDEADVPAWDDDDLVGPAPCSSIVDLSVATLQLDGGREDTMVPGFDWAVEHKEDDWGDGDPSNDGIDVLTVSLSPEDGTDGSDAISQAVNRAVEAGIVVVGSMGNSGPDYAPFGTPAAADLSIAVANIDDMDTVRRGDDELAANSPPGPRPSDGDENPYDEMKPDIAAPGVRIWTTGSSAGDGTEYQLACLAEDEPYEERPRLPYDCQTRFTGTSASTPLMAGVIALMLSANPVLSPGEVKEILHQTAEPHVIQEPAFPALNAKYSLRFGWGMVDAYKAVLMAKQWPGMEIGRDMDSDGVRDLFDSDPYDARNSTLVIPNGFEALGGDYDTDGDLIPDAQDPAPLDPEDRLPVDDVDRKTTWPAVAAIGALLFAATRRMKQ